MKKAPIIEFLAGLALGLLLLAFFEFIAAVEGDDPPASRGAHAALQIALVGLTAGAFLRPKGSLPTFNRIWNLGWASTLGLVIGGTALGTAFFQTEWFQWPKFGLVPWFANVSTSVALGGAAFAVGWLWQTLFPQSAHNID